MRLIPRKLFLTRGVGIHKEKLTSFELSTARGRYCPVQPGPRFVDFPTPLPDRQQR